MKRNFRRRHLRPRPTRSQVNQQLQHARSAIQLFQVEALLEAHKPELSLGRLRFLDEAVGQMKDEVLSLEQI
jgi:uncharacterized membrane protein YccC